MTVLSDAPDACIRIARDAAEISLPASCTPSGVEDVRLAIRRAGCVEDADRWDICYRQEPRVSAEDPARFRLDKKFRRLKPGYYDAAVFEDCKFCGLIRLDMTKQRSFNTRAATEIERQPIPEPGGAIEGVNTMFDRYLNFKTTLNCDLSATSGSVKINGSVPGPVPETPPQLVLHDGVNSEVVTLVSTSYGVASVERGSPAYAFPRGACLQFEWTLANVQAVADTVEVPADPATDTDGTGEGDASCAVLEAGKGLRLVTSPEGSIKVELVPTGVVPGDHNGIEIDECGRVVSVGAKFPDVPVFDPCCKEDDHETDAV